MTTSAPSPSRLPRWVPPLLAGALIAGLGLALLRPASPTATGNPLVGKTAPDFNLTAMDGQTVHLAALKNQPVILNFWASWCGPCQKEAPLLHELSSRQEAQGFKMVGLLFQETSEANARKFIDQHGLNYPNILTKNADTGISYGIAGIPVTVFIDKAGVVQHIDQGGLDKDRLNAGLAKIGVQGL